MVFDFQTKTNSRTANWIVFHTKLKYCTSVLIWIWKAVFPLETIDCTRKGLKLTRNEKTESSLKNAISSNWSGITSLLHHDLNLLKSRLSRISPICIADFSFTECAKHGFHYQKNTNWIYELFFGRDTRLQIIENPGQCELSGLLSVSSQHSEIANMRIECFSTVRWRRMISPLKDPSASPIHLQIIAYWGRNVVRTR